jgi:hypothetical protein
VNHSTILQSIPAVLLLSATLGLADGPMDCVTEMTMPNFTNSIMTAVPATVQVHVTIGKNGRASAVDYGGAKKLLQLKLDQFFKDEAKYAQACEGRTIEGLPTSSPVWAVRFRSPNKFVVAAHPIPPSLDPFPQIAPQKSTSK